jgi:hypothetical protein
MALAPCRECRREVSTEAATCPHCGVGNPARLITHSPQARPVPTPPTRSRALAWVIFVGVIVFAFGLPLRRRTGDNASSSASSDNVAPRRGPAHINRAGAIWKDNDSYSRGRQLVRSGVQQTNPEMLLPLVSCVVEPGGRVTVIGPSGYGLLDIVVTSGKHRGCTGLIQEERVGP